MLLTPELKKHIDNMTVQQLLANHRFSKLGDPFFQGESGEYAVKRLAELREQKPEEYINASKSIGW